MLKICATLIATCHWTHCYNYFSKNRNVNKNNIEEGTCTLTKPILFVQRDMVQRSGQKKKKIPSTDFPHLILCSQLLSSTETKHRIHQNGT